MKKMKKTLAMLLCIIMCLSLFPVQVLAEETVTADLETAETAAVEMPAEESAENVVSVEDNPAEVPIEGQEPAGEPVEGDPARKRIPMQALTLREILTARMMKTIPLTSP